MAAVLCESFIFNIFDSDFVSAAIKLQIANWINCMNTRAYCVRLYGTREAYLSIPAQTPHNEMGDQMVCISWKWWKMRKPRMSVWGIYDWHTYYTLPFYTHDPSITKCPPPPITHRSLVARVCGTHAHTQTPNDKNIFTNMRFLNYLPQKFITVNNPTEIGFHHQPDSRRETRNTQSARAPHTAAHTAQTICAMSVCRGAYSNCA